MGLFKDLYFKLSSEEKLRKKADKMWEKLDKVDYFESTSTKHRGLANKYTEYCNMIRGKGIDKLPKREHGWYISKDD